MSGSKSRNKGRAYEQKIAREYRDLGHEARRGWQSRQGDDEPDVILESNPEVWIECKHHARGGLAFRTMEQAEKAAKPDAFIVLHLKETHGEELVCLRKEDWYSVMDYILRSKE